MKKPLNLTGHIINQMTATTTRHEQLTGKVVPNEPEISNKKIQNSSLSGSCATGFPNGLFFDKPLPNPGITNDTQTRFEQLSGKKDLTPLVNELLRDVMSSVEPLPMEQPIKLPNRRVVMIRRDKVENIPPHLLGKIKSSVEIAAVSELNFKRVSELKHEDLMDTKDKPVVDANPWEGWGRDNYPSVLSMPDPRFRHDRAPYPSALQALQAGNKAIDITCLNGDDVTSESYQRLTAGMTLSEDFKYIINRALGLAHPNAEAAKECMGALNALKQWDTEYGAQAFFADRRFKQRANELAQAMVYTGIGAARGRLHFQAKPANVDPYEKIGFMKLAGQGVFERAPDLTWLVLAAERCLRPKEVFNRLVDAWLFEVTAEIKKGVPGAAVKRTDVIGELAAQGLCQDVYMKHIAAPASTLAHHPRMKFYLDPPESMAPFSAQLDDLCNKVASWTDVTRDMDIDMEPIEMPNAMMYKPVPYDYVLPVAPAKPWQSRTSQAGDKLLKFYQEAQLDFLKDNPMARELLEEIKQQPDWYQRVENVGLVPPVLRDFGREFPADGVPRIVEITRDEDGNIAGKIETPLKPQSE